MADEIDPIKLQVILDAQKANNDVKAMGEMIKKVSKESGFAFDSIATSLKNLFSTKYAGSVLEQGFHKLVDDATRANSAITKVNEAIRKVGNINANFDLQNRAGGIVNQNSSEYAKLQEERINSSGKIALANRKIMESEMGLIDTSAPLTESQRRIVESLQRTERASVSWSKALRNAVNTVIGTLTAIGTFAVIQTIQEFFTTSIKLAQDFENSLRRINLAEAFLSESGMDVTKKQLTDLVDFLQEKYKNLLPKVDFQGIVADVAMMTREYGLTFEQVKKLSDAIAFIQIQAKLNGQDDVNAAQITNAILDKRNKGLNQYGVNVADQVVKDKAVTAGLVKQGEVVDGNAKVLATLLAVYDQTGAKAEELTTSLEGTRQGLEMQNKAALDTIKTNVGEWFLNIEFSVLKAFDALKKIEGVFDPIIGKFDILGTIWESITTPLRFLYSLLLSISTIMATTGAGFITFWGKILQGASLADAFKQAGNAMGMAFRAGLFEVLDAFVGKADNFGNRFMKSALKSVGVDLDTYRKVQEASKQNNTDTPTSPQTPENKNPEDIAGATKKFNDEILQAQIKFSQDMQDVEIDLGRKMVDITAEYAKKRADAEKDYSNKVADINSSYQDKISSIKQKESEANQKNRDDELKREKAFQEKMQEMKERFLMDLDDALHARDARQILKLIKRYDLEKLQAERQHALDAQNAQIDNKREQQKFAQERSDAEKERKAKLADAQRDYNDKVAKLKADEDAEVQAAVLAANRKIQDLEKNNADRLAIIASNLVSEFNLTQQGLQAIANLYHQYYADVSGVYAAMNAMMAGSTGMGAVAGQVGQQKGNGLGTANGTVGTKSSLSSVRKFASGGSMIADQATNVTFGEGGLELATFTPIGRNGADTNKLFSNMGGGNGSESGGISIELLLSPDLESRIVKNTLGRTAEIFTRVQRSKG